MGWQIEVIFLLLIRYTTADTGILQTHISLPQNFVDEDVQKDIDNVEYQKPPTILRQYEDFKLDHLGRVLANILVQPWPRGVSPILYVEDVNPEPVHEEVADENRVNEAEEISNAPYKRSRYYRKYPWKRQNSRYDAENRYLCQPTKEDVFRLLVALHEARQGNRGQMVNFCNRRRPASAIFTNIRFLG